MPGLDYLRTPRPPWIALIARDEAASLADLTEGRADLLVRRIDGARCPTKEALLNELARAFALPPYFGENWDALEECLTDLTWLPADGYLLVVDHADGVLSARPADYRIFVQIARAIGKTWAKPRTGVAARRALPFHVLLIVDGEVAERDWQVPRVSRGL